MARRGAKTQAALKSRQAAFDKISNNETALKSYGQYHHKPGSQNRKKGYGVSRRR